jgi:drug/metabolite transporter (DMT)-like permease
MRPRIALKAFVAIALWGASFVATKVVLQELSPVSIIIVRFALGLSVLASILVLNQNAVSSKSTPGLIKRGDWRWFLLLGFNGIFIHQMLQVNGLASTSATNTGWMVALIPIFTALLAWLLMQEAFGPVRIAGLVLSLFGTLLVVSRGELGSSAVGLPATWGDVFVFLSAINWAVFSVLSKRILDTYAPAFAMTIIMGLGWLMLLPLFLGSSGWRELTSLSVEGWLALLFLGLFCSGVAYVFWYDALGAAEAGRVASFLYLEPLVTLLVAMLVLNEKPTLGTLTGGSFILTGVWLVNRP